MASVIIFIAAFMFLQGALGELVCEELAVKVCAFAIASSGKRCSLETYPSKDGGTGFECKTSDIVASNINLREHTENDDCISSCGVERHTVGISTDKFLEPEFSKKLCSDDCLSKCHNIVDLYSNLALAEGVYLPALCNALAVGSRRKMRQIQSSGAVSNKESVQQNGQNHEEAKSAVPALDAKAKAEREAKAEVEAVAEAPAPSFYWAT